MKKIRLFLLSFAIPLALIAQPYASTAEEENVIKKEKLDPFSELEITNGAHVTVQYSEENAISIIGYQHCIDAIKTEVTDGRLIISTSNSEMSCPVEIVLEVPEIKDVTLRNGGFIDMTEVTTDTLFAAVHEGGEIKAVVHDFLYAKIINGGVINYVGNPDVQSDVIRSGRVLQTDPMKAYQFTKITASL